MIRHFPSNLAARSPETDNDDVAVLEALRGSIRSAVKLIADEVAWERRPARAAVDAKRAYERVVPALLAAVASKCPDPIGMIRGCHTPSQA